MFSLFLRESEGARTQHHPILDELDEHDTNTLVASLQLAFEYSCKKQHESFAYSFVLLCAFLLGSTVITK